MTNTDRHAVLPAESRARTMMGLEPFSNGISLHVQFAVPCAVILPPFEFSHVTETTPTLSDADPVNVIAALETERVVCVGEVIVSEGAEVSF